MSETLGSGISAEEVYRKTLKLESRFGDSVDGCYEPTPDFRPPVSPTQDGGYVRIEFDADGSCTTTFVDPKSGLGNL